MSEQPEDLMGTGPAGFTQEVGGATGASSDPDEVREVLDLPAASEHGPRTDAERREAGEEPDSTDDIPRTG